MCIKDTQWVSPPNSTYWTLAVSAATNSILNPYYDGWLIKLNVPWHWWTETRSRYITITTGILKWITNKILYASWDDIYISGTNVYWSLPDNDDKYFIFSRVDSPAPNVYHSRICVQSLDDIISSSLRCLSFYNFARNKPCNS